VPAYDDGNAPFGQYAAGKLFTSTQWANQGNIDYDIGYPAASPYDGSDIAWCNGPVATDSCGGTSAQGMVCNMTGGSSGGPWFINYNETSGIGTLNSVNSFKYNGGPLANRMFGPHFGSVVQGVYNAAQA